MKPAHKLDESDWKITQAATCTTEGERQGTCEACSEAVTEVIPVDSTAHSFTDYVYNNDAKVGVDGTETAECDNGCGTTYTRAKAGTALSGGSGGLSGGGGVGGFGGGGVLPPAQETQDPTVTADENATVTQSADGSSLTITPKDGYEIADVVVNGVSKGAVSTVTGLKTGDVVVITTQMTAEKIAYIKAGVEATKITLKSTTNKKGIRLDWTKKKGFAVDYYEVFRSLKKDGSYGKQAFYTTKSGKIKQGYINTKNLKKGTQYYYKVRGVRILNGEKIYTQWSNRAWRKSTVTKK